VVVAVVEAVVEMVVVAAVEVAVAVAVAVVVTVVAVTVVAVVIPVEVLVALFPITIDCCWSFSNLRLLSVVAVVSIFAVGIVVVGRIPSTHRQQGKNTSSEALTGCRWKLDENKVSRETEKEY
jgi:hypothetical protein